MGLIKAGVGSLGGTLADQWKEFFYCDALSPEVLAVKGQKRVSGRSSNTKGSDNIISNGSVIAVADGQCMMIVEQGKVVEFCAEPGQFVFDASTEPSIFTGSFGKSLLDTFKTVGRRFTFGGDTGKDQRVYYFNTKEIVDNKFGTATPIPFRVVDRNIGLDIDIAIRCYGEYSYKTACIPTKFPTPCCSTRMCAAMSRATTSAPRLTACSRRSSSARCSPPLPASPSWRSARVPCPPMPRSFRRS